MLSEKAAVPHKKGNNGWSPPVYCRSGCKPVTPEVLIENRCIGLKPDEPELEAYKVLRTRIQHRFNVNGWKTLMVTSAFPGEGKTLTSVNLTMAFAKAFNQTVMLVDADLQQQKVHRYLGLNSDWGLCDYLLEGRPLEDLIIWPNIEKMTLISGGRPVQDSAELIGSPQMHALVKEMKHRYEDRYVIFDLPPILGRADALSFSAFVDGIIMVVEAGKTPLKTIKDAVRQLPPSKFMGFVFNKNSCNSRQYYQYK